MIERRTVAQAKRLGIVSCRGSDRLAQIATRMADDDISALVVVDDDGFLVGIISRVDLLRACVESRDWRQEPVERHMTREVLTVAPDSYLDEVLEILLTRQIHRVVVVREENGGQRPIAVISDSDLVCEMADDI